jgi:hypothetical protein
MNIRRGLLRLWIVGSIAWICIVGFHCYGAYSSTVYASLWTVNPTIPPGCCGYGKDPTTPPGGLLTPEMRAGLLAEAKKRGLVVPDKPAEQQTSAASKLPPEADTGGLQRLPSDVYVSKVLGLKPPAAKEEVGLKLKDVYRALVWSEKYPMKLSQLEETLIIQSHLKWALGPPLAILIVGAALSWVFAGFRKTRRGDIGAS